MSDEHEQKNAWKSKKSPRGPPDHHNKLYTIDEMTITYYHS